MTHKQKLTMARRMMKQSEIKDQVSPFDSEAWKSRKIARQERVNKLINKTV